MEYKITVFHEILVVYRTIVHLQKKNNNNLFEGDCAIRLDAGCKSYDSTIYNQHQMNNCYFILHTFYFIF